MKRRNGKSLVLHSCAIFRSLEWWLNGRDPVSSLVSFLKRKQEQLSEFSVQVKTYTVKCIKRDIWGTLQIFSLGFGWQMDLYIAKIAFERKREETKDFTVKSEQKFNGKYSHYREFDNRLPSFLSFLAKSSFVPFCQQKKQWKIEFGIFRNMRKHVSQEKLFNFLKGIVVQKEDRKCVGVNRWTFLTSIHHWVCKKAR